MSQDGTMVEETKRVRRGFYALAVSSVLAGTIVGSMLSHSWKFLDDVEHGREAQIPESELLDQLRASTQGHIILESICGFLLICMWFPVFRGFLKGTRRPGGYLILSGMLPLWGIAGVCGALVDEKARPIAMTFAALLPLGILSMSIGLGRRFGASLHPALKREALIFSLTPLAFQISYFALVSAGVRLVGTALSVSNAVIGGIALWGLWLAIRAGRSIP